MLDENQENLPRDRETLLREVSLGMQLKDIRRYQNLREQLAPRWWERMLIIALFLSTVGFIVTLITINFAPLKETPPVLDYALYAAFTFMMVSLIAVLEFLLAMVVALRRMCLLLSHDLQELHQALKEAGDKPDSPE